MFDANALLESETDQLNHELAAAAVMAQKVADAKGVNLDSLSDGEVERLISIAAGVKTATASEPSATPSPTPTTKEAGADPMTTTPATPATPTVVDVTHELYKLAADAGIDLRQLPREKVAEYFDNLAREMAEPNYAEKKAALEQAEAEKVAAAEADDAWADRMGRKMARSFHDEDQKIAKEMDGKGDEKPEGKKDDDDADDKGEKKEAAMPPWLQRAGTAAHNIKELGKHTAMAAGSKAKEIAKEHGPTAAAAAGGAAAANAAKSKDKGEEKHASFDAAVIKRAQEYLSASGFDPNTGEKIAAAETPAPAATEVEPDWNKLAADPAAVDRTARALLEQAGFSFQS